MELEAEGSDTVDVPKEQMQDRQQLEDEDEYLAVTQRLDRRLSLLPTVRKAKKLIAQ